MHELDNLTDPGAMQKAIDEALLAYKAGENFPARYHFSRSTKWIVLVNGVEIDSKPLVAAAFEYQFGRPLQDRIYGGTQVIVDALDRFGLKLEDRRIGLTQEWSTPVGTVGSKKDFSQLYGGSTMGGIQPSARTPNVLFYSDPAVGTTFGYDYDGWSADGAIYSYTGEGQHGPQTLKGGNGAILRHQEDGRALRLFVSDGYFPRSRTKRRIYVGEFEIDDTHPYSVEDALDDDGELRTVYVFHLKPAGQVLQREEDFSPAAMAPRREAVAELVAMENHTSAEFPTSGTGPGIAEKREQSLVAAFLDALSQRGHKVRRWKITPPESTRALFSDVYDETSGVLYEAKSEATRNHVRLGLGQILDYRRYTPQVRSYSLLLPAAPHSDLLELLGNHDVGAVWLDSETGGFMSYSKQGRAIF